MASQLDMFEASVKRHAATRTDSVGRCRRCGYEGPGPRHNCARPSIAERFEAFHQANPHVLTELLALARRRLEAGEKRIGVKALWEQLRGHIAVADVNPAGLAKLNNDFTAPYSRLLIELEPRLAGVIEIRRRKS